MAGLSAQVWGPARPPSPRGPIAGSPPCPALAAHLGAAHTFSRFTRYVVGKNIACRRAPLSCPSQETRPCERAAFRGPGTGPRPGRWQGGPRCPAVEDHAPNCAADRNTAFTPEPHPHHSQQDIVDRRPRLQLAQGADPVHGSPADLRAGADSGSALRAQLTAAPHALNSTGLDARFSSTGSLAPKFAADQLGSPARPPPGHGLGSRRTHGRSAAAATSARSRTRPSVQGAAASRLSINALHYDAVATRFTTAPRGHDTQ